MYKFQTILNKGKFYGIAPSAEPFAIGANIQSVENLRFDGNSYKSRGGSSGIHATPAVGTFVGGAVIGSYVYVGILVSGNVEVYARTVTGGSWVLITASAGYYGDTRLSNPARWLSFSGFSIGGGTVISIQDGTNPPLWYVEGGAAGSAVPSESLTAPIPWPVTFGASAGLDVNGGGTTSDSGGTLTTSISSGWVFTSVSALTAEYAQVVTTGVAFPSARQVWIIVKDVSQEVLDLLTTSLEFQLVDGSGPVITLPKESVRVLTSVPGVDILAFDVQQETIGTITGLRLRVTVSVPSFTLKVIGVCSGGVVSGDAKYKASYLRATGASESAGVQLEVEGATTLTGMVPQSGFRAPLSSGLYYQTTQNVKASPDALTGASAVNIYRRDPRDEDFFRVDSLAASQYSGSWSYTANFSTRAYNYTDSVRTEDKSFKVAAPSENNAPIPIGAGFSAAGRHYVGGSFILGQKGISVSDKNYPWRFRYINNAFNLEEGYSIDLDADEDVVGFATSSSSNIGSPVVYGLTTKGIYAILPVSSRISSVGAACYGVDYDGPIFFFTADNHCAVLSSRTQRISQNRVESYITDVSRVSVAAFRERVYFCTPGRNLVFNIRQGDWESADPISSLAMVTTDASKKNLYGFSTAGAFWKLEDSSIDTDFAGAVTGFIETGLISDGQEESWARRFMLLGQYPNNVTTTRTPASGSASAGTITGNADTPAWYFDENAEVHSVGVKLKVATTLDTDFRLYQWDAELQLSKAGPKI